MPIILKQTSESTTPIYVDSADGETTKRIVKSALPQFKSNLFSRLQSERGSTNVPTPVAVGAAIALILALASFFYIGFVGMEKEKDSINKYNQVKSNSLRSSWGDEVFNICKTELNRVPAQISDNAKIVFVTYRKGIPDINEDAITKFLSPRLIAKSKNSATHVACIAINSEVIDKHTYTAGGVCERWRTSATGTLINLKDRTIIAEWSALGSEPAECPESKSRSNYSITLSGDDPNVVDGFHKVLNRKP